MNDVQVFFLWRKRTHGGGGFERVNLVENVLRNFPDSADNWPFKVAMCQLCCEQTAASGPSTSLATCAATCAVSASLCISFRSSFFRRFSYFEEKIYLFGLVPWLRRCNGVILLFGWLRSRRFNFPLHPSSARTSTRP